MDTIATHLLSSQAHAVRRIQQAPQEPDPELLQVVPYYLEGCAWNWHGLVTPDQTCVCGSIEKWIEKVDAEYLKDQLEAYPRAK